MRTWTLQNAKARLSAVVRAARDGPQAITLRGDQVAVLTSVEEYNRLNGRESRTKPMTLLAALQACPYKFETPPRDRATGRSVKL
jgi:antitoxin Phd